MSQQYVRVLVAAGAIPWIIPLIQGDTATLRRSTIVSTASFFPVAWTSIPSAYQEGPNDLCGHTDPARDEIELTLTRWALEDKKPLSPFVAASRSSTSRPAERFTRTSPPSFPARSSTTTSRGGGMYHP